MILAPRRGAAMPVVLGILVLVGVLMSLQFVRAKQQEDLVGIWQGKSLARWLAIAGRNLAIERLDSGDSALMQGAAIEEWYAPGRRGVGVRMERDGLLWSAVTVPLGRVDKAKSSRAEIGFVAAETPPALILLEPGDVVLGGDSRIQGDVVMSKGRLVASPWALLPAGPNAGHRGRLDTNRAEVERWIPRLDELESWWDSLQRIKASAAEFDTVMEHQTLVRDKPVVLGKSVRWKGVRLVAPVIRIGTGAVLDDCLIVAKDSLFLNGKPIIHSGQYLSGDTMGIDMDGAVSGTPLFAVLYDGLSAGALRGIMDVRRMSGEVVLLSWARNGRVPDDKIRLVVGKDSRLSGLAATSGVLDVTSATWTGTLIATRVGVRTNGIWYGNALHDSKLRAAEAGFWPLWFPRAHGRRVGRPISWSEDGIP